MVYCGIASYRVSLLRQETPLEREIVVIVHGVAISRTRLEQPLTMTPRASCPWPTQEGIPIAASGSSLSMLPTISMALIPSSEKLSAASTSSRRWKMKLKWGIRSLSSV